jgi:hypothetical protein
MMPLWLETPAQQLRLLCCLTQGKLQLALDFAGYRVVTVIPALTGCYCCQHECTVLTQFVAAKLLPSKRAIST